MKKLFNFFRRVNYRIKVRRMNRKANFRHFKKAVHQAEYLSIQNDNKRYRVFLFDEYRVWSREDIQRMKNRGVLSKKQETGLLSKQVLYDTLGHSNLHPTFSNRKL